MKTSSEKFAPQVDFEKEIPAMLIDTEQICPFPHGQEICKKHIDAKDINSKSFTPKVDFRREIPSMLIDSERLCPFPHGSRPCREEIKERECDRDVKNYE